MAAIKCTNCGAILRPKDPIPAGKKVKCPKCTQVFVVQAEEPEQPKPAPVPAPEPAAASPGEDEAAAAPSKEAFKFGDEAASSAEGEPAQKEDKGKKKSNTMLILIIAGAVLLCCCCLSTCGGLGYLFEEQIKRAVGITKDTKGGEDKPKTAK